MCSKDKTLDTGHDPDMSANIGENVSCVFCKWYGIVDGITHTMNQSVLYFNA